MSRHDGPSDLLVVGIAGVAGGIVVVTVRRSGIAGSITATGRHRVDGGRNSATAGGQNNGGVTVGGCDSNVGASGGGAGGIVTISRHRGRVRRAAIVNGWRARIAVDGHIARNRAINRRNNCIARSEITVNRCGVSTAGRCKIGTDRRPLPGLGVSEITLSRSEPNRHDRRLICEIIAHSSSLSPSGRHCGHA